jgi:hypothetical protein
MILPSISTGTCLCLDALHGRDPFRPGAWRGAESGLCQAILPVEEQARIDVPGEAVLEHHHHIAPLRRPRVHDPAIDQDLASAGRLKPRRHAQDGGLAAAGRPDHDQELSVGVLEREVIDGAGPAGKDFSILGNSTSVMPARVRKAPPNDAAGSMNLAAA